MTEHAKTLTTAELAEIVDRQPRTVQKWIREGYLDAVRIGREYRISKADANKWWRSRGGDLLFPEAPVPTTSQRKLEEKIEAHLSGQLQSLYHPFRAKIVTVEGNQDVIVSYNLDTEERHYVIERYKEDDTPERIATRLQKKITNGQ